MHKITLYTKPGCHLCDRAKETISRLVSAHATVLVEEIDILSDPALQAQYQNDIPVILVDGIERFRHTVDPQKLAELFYDEFGEKLIGF